MSTTTTGTPVDAPARGARPVASMGRPVGGRWWRSVDPRRIPQRWQLWVVLAIAVLVRTPFLGKTPGNDESGYLMVGGQWYSGSGSLYGGYWVDRPPLLVFIFGLASQLGGLVAIRLLGCLAVAVTVFAVHRAVRAMTAGAEYAERAALWSAILAATLLSASLLSVYEIDGEILAAPFVATGVALVASALSHLERRHAEQGLTDNTVRPLLLAGLGGAAGVCAVLVKQNFVDVFVFAGVAVVLLMCTRRIAVAQGVRVFLAGLVGGLVAVGVAALWSVLHGTSLSGIWYAMYPFRLDSGALTSAARSSAATARSHVLLLNGIVTGMIPVLLAVLGGLFWKRSAASKQLRSAYTWALLVLSAFVVYSVIAGAAYWLHYLIQGVVPVACLLGLALATGMGWLRALVVYAVAAALVGMTLVNSLTASGAGAGSSHAVADVSRPGDSIITAYGHAEFAYGTGLPSPYEHLWSLPIRTLDPQLTKMTAVLAGPSAPTWFVTWRRTMNSWGIDPATAEVVLVQRYHRVADLCGHVVYLRDDLDRATPRPPATCGHASVATKLLRKLS